MTPASLLIHKNNPMRIAPIQLFCAFLCAPFLLHAQARDSAAVARTVDSLVYAIDARIQKKDYQTAQQLCTDARKLAEETWGPRSEQEAKCMFQEARLLKELEQLDASEQIYLAAGDILLAKYGATSDEYISVINNLSGLYRQMGRYKEAERLLKQILEACNANPAIKDALRHKAEFNLGSVYRNLGRYQESEQLLNALLEKPNFKKDTVQYRNALSAQASNYSILGRYAASDSLYQLVLAQYAAALGRESAVYARELTNLINLYDDRGEVNRAIDTAMAALAIQKKIYGENHPIYARTLSNTANIFAGLGDYSKAETLQKQALEIRASRLGKDHPDYAMSLQNLGAIYASLGRAGAAEALYFQALELQRRKLGENHATVARTQGNLGTLYARLGIYDKAERNLLASLDGMRRSLGASHAEYARTLGNLSLLYADMGDNEKAVSYLTEAIRVSELTQGADHAATIGRYISLANLLNDTDPLRADSLTQALQIQMIRLGLEETKEYPRLLKCKADIQARRGEYAAAATQYAALYSDARARFGDDYPNNVEYATKAARSYLVLGNTEAALPYLIATYESDSRRLEQSRLFMSERELLVYTGKLADCFNLLTKARYIADTNGARLDTVLLDNLLLIKGVALQSGIKIRQALASDTLLQRLADASRMLQVRLNAAYQNPKVSRDTIAVLEWQADSIQKIQVRAAAASNSGLFAAAEIRPGEALRAGEAAVEFAHFQWLRNNGGASDSVLYYALVQFPGRAAPHFVPLFEEKQLARLLDKTGDDARQASNLYAAARSGELLDAAPAYGTALYNLIWRPLDSLLQAQKIKTVYFSPSGLLHRVAFAALPVDGKKMLSDRYALRRLGSTRSLAVKTPEPVADHFTAAVFGGIVYDRGDAASPSDSSMAMLPDNRLWRFLERPRSGVQARFDFLPGALQEARRLEQLFARRRVRTQSLTGLGATEEAFKALGADTVKSPDILHVATHGFFFPDPEKSRAGDSQDEHAFKWNENPLLRSGLALTGANAAWNGQSAPGNIEDGIATAYEISHLNLSNTKLAVLSACQTGLGDIKGSEGVFGLQRAFKMAGVDYLLVSLWQVPDQATADFMEAFYSAWLGGKTIHEAFAKAQKKMRKQYKSVYQWGAWVLVE